MKMPTDKTIGLGLKAMIKADVKYVSLILSYIKKALILEH